MKLRPITVLGIVVLLSAAGGAAALYVNQKRDVTSTSADALRAYREAVENERRYYFREARVGFARALELDNEFAMAMLGLARQARDKEQALALIRRAERLKPRLTDRERRQIDLAFAVRSGQGDKAEAIAREMLEKDPGDIRAASFCAGREVGRGRQDKAVEIFKGLLEVNPNSAEAYNLLGYYHAYRGELDKAIEYLKKYQFMSPDQANPHDSLGEVLAFSGRYDEAIQNLEQALKVKPDFFASYAHLAVAYMGKGDNAKAREMWLKQAAIVESDPERYTALMLALRSAMLDNDQKTITALIPQISKLTEQKELSHGRHTLAAVLALSRGRGADAEAELTALKPELHQKYDDMYAKAGMKPYFEWWTYLMATAKTMQGKEDEAIGLYEQMISPPNPWADFVDRQWIYDARAELAVILARRGQLDSAEKLLEENHKWNPSWAPAREAELTVARLRREKVLAAAK